MTELKTKKERKMTKVEKAEKVVGLLQTLWSSKGCITCLNKREQDIACVQLLQRLKAFDIDPEEFVKSFNILKGRIAIYYDGGMLHFQGCYNQPDLYAVAIVCLPD